MKLYWRYKKDGKWTWKPAKEWSKRPEGGILVGVEEEE